MIGSEDDRIVDAAVIEQCEKVAELAVELEEVEAHLLALGAIFMANEISRRKADRQDIGRLSPPEPHFVDQPAGESERVAVELGRGAKRRGIARGARKLPDADRLAAPLDRDGPRLPEAEGRRLERGTRL